MSDQQELPPYYFKTVLNDIELQIRALSGQEFFLIKLTDLQRPECYEQIIDSSYMRNHDITFFPTPTDLMKHMAVHYKDLRIQSGCIRFSVNYSKALNPRHLALKIREKKVDRVELINTKVSKTKKELMEKLAQQEETIEWLRSEVLKMRGNQRESKKMDKNFFFSPVAHQQGYQNEYFSTSLTGQSIIVKHKPDGRPQNHMFVLNQQILVGEVKRYTIKTERSEEMNQLCICFGSRHILRDNLISKPWVVAYQCNGGLIQGGSSRQSKVSTMVCNQLQCEISLDRYNIKWMTKGEVFDTTELPEKMRNQKLYFAVLFSSENQRIEIALK